MARYKVLKSVAHNFAHSFVSLMNYDRKNYVMCHLAKRAEGTGRGEFRLDVLRQMAGPLELLSRPVIESSERYCRDFGRLITNSGAALDMVSEAELTVRVRLGRQGTAVPSGVHRVTAIMRLTDDRGRVHIGRATEEYRC